MKPIIEVKGLSKRYKLGVFNAKTLREEAEGFLAKFSGKKAHAASGPATSNSQLATAEPSSDFWALRDVSFDVQPGEVIGVIGRNGAGKSTLLKILSRVTEPTSGEARIRGRIASLLEVGTGFHPELTGRENIFLNGAILGMSKAEIRSKFDEIVAFSGIEKFIDTPVKRYSSGMYVRLAFAVAAHLEPEILIIDEVLAVGDAEFQKKCLGKMKDVAGHGRTVLFVSHNMAAIQHLCPRALLMQNGCLSQDGNSDEVVGAYLKRMHAMEGEAAHIKSFDGKFAITHTLLKDEAGRETSTFKAGDTLIVEMHYDAKEPIEAPYFWMSVANGHGSLLVASMLLDGFRPDRISGRGFVRVKFPRIPLLPQNSYFIQAGMRYKDAKSLVFPSGDMAHFNVTGSAADSGFASPVADEFLANSAGIVANYEWEMSSGENFIFEPLHSNARKNPI